MIARLPATLPPLRFEHVAHESPLGRWRFTAAFPAGPLAEEVEVFWTNEAEWAYSRESILPRSQTEVLFNLGPPHWLHGPGGTRRFETSWVSGLQQRPLEVESHPNARMAGVRLRPAGVLPFFGLSPAELAGDVVDLRSVLGAWVEELRERLALERNPERRLMILAGWIAARVGDGPRPSAEVRRAVRALGRSAGKVPIRSVVRDSGWSHRHFTDRFRREVGLAPKAFARIVRFQGALLRLPRLSRVHWAELAAELGWYDQAHLVHDFRELAGATPTEVLRRLGPDSLGLVEDSK